MAENKIELPFINAYIDDKLVTTSAEVLSSIFDKPVDFIYITEYVQLELKNKYTVGIAVLFYTGEIPPQSDIERLIEEYFAKCK